jgi:DNA-binding transcriptional MocR family regulator
MTDSTPSMISRQLAKRVSALRTERAPVRYGESPLPTGLLAHLQEHLERGETHYTTRPGLPELRSSVAGKIRKRGGPDRDANSVIVTHGEGEALYVTLLGLGIGAKSIVAVSCDCHHRGLLEVMGIQEVDPDDPKAGHAMASYREVREGFDDLAPVVREGCFEILSLGGLLFSEEPWDSDLSSLSDHSIVIGHFDSLPGLDHFRMGYVAGPPELVKRMQTWKQALSICSAAPSQRAAMFLLSEESDS